MLTQTCLWLAQPLLLFRENGILEGGETDWISPVKRMLGLISQKASFPELKMPGQSAEIKSPWYIEFGAMFGAGGLSSHVGNL